MEKKERRQITTSQKLQIIQTVDENPNMKRIDIARMMNIPSSTLNTILAKRTTLESACNDGNSSTRKRIRSGNFAELEE
ncbi:Major centromere autoantigen B, partial [Trichinella patagoniensis]